jgi:WD40 repeat protein
MSEPPPKLVRIFISSPSDVAEERRVAAELIEQELAKREAFRETLKLGVFRYDDPHSDTAFRADRSRQASVGDRLQSAEAEIIVAILWARMGTPVRDPADPTKILYQSGTEQEVEEALKAGRKVQLYFRRGQPPAPEGDDELKEFGEQRRKVRAFRERLERNSRGVNDYQDVDDFKRKLAQHLDQLLTRIRDASLTPAGQATTAPEPWTRKPYPGLRSFDPDEAPIFFGRKDETSELVRWVAEEGRRFVAVIGASGSGKSSLVKAGLVPVLPKWPSVIVRLIYAGNDPFRALANKLEPLLPPSRRREFKANPAKGLATLNWVDEILAEKPASSCLMIVIDQFEELQTAVAENLRTRFVALLKDLTTHNRVRIVATLRADFLGALSHDETLARLLRGNSFVLHPPGAAALGAIIREPARLVGVAVEDQLIDELVEAARLEPGALPLLAFALERLYASREGERLARPAVGGSTTLGAILSDYTGKVEKALSPEQREALPRLFRHLVRVEDGGRRVVKRRCRAADVGEDAILIALRDHLIEARLLTALDDPTEVELAHDTLIQAWPSLRDWVKAYGRHLVVRDDVERLRASGAPRLDGWLLERALDLRDQAPELLDEAQAALVRHSFEEYQDFLRREANAVAERAATCIKEDDCTTAIALCLEVLPPTPRSRRPATSAALSTLCEAWRALRELRVIKTGPGVVLAASFSPDGTQLVNVGNDGTVRLWRTDGSGPLILGRHAGWVGAVSFSPDGRLVVSAGADGTVRLWHVDGFGEPLILRGPKGGVQVASISPDGTRVVSAGEDGTVRLWHADGTSEPMILRGHEGAVYAALFSPDGKLVVSAGWDRTVRLWNADGMGQPRILYGHEGWVNAASFSPDGTRVVSAGGDGTVRLWCADGSGEPLILRGHEGCVNAVSFSPDGTFVVSAGQDGTVRLWHANGIGQPLILRGHEGSVRAASFSPDGTRVFSAGDDATMRLWRADEMSELLRIFCGHDSTVSGASFNPDGTRLVSGGHDGTVRLWNADGTGEPVIFRGHEGWVNAASFSPDGRRVVSAGEDGTVRLWHADGSGEPPILCGHQGAVWAASFNPDGVRLASAGEDGTVRLWHADGTGEPLILRGHEGRVYAASFSPDETRVVSAGADGTVQLRQADGVGVPLILHGHDGVVTAASFSPDGTLVVSAGSDRTVRLWQRDGTGESLTLRGHDGEVSAASFSPDETRVVSAGQDGTVRVWYVFASEYALIEAARASLPRQLSDAQRAKYHLPPRGV